MSNRVEPKGSKVCRVSGSYYFSATNEEVENLRHVALLADSEQLLSNTRNLVFI